MKKEEMLTEIKWFFNEFEDILVLCNIPHILFFKWFYKFDTHPELVKAYRFIFNAEGFMKRLLIVRAKYKIMSPEIWKRLKLLGDDSDEIKALKNSIREAKNKWKDRPRLRKGAE